jgi:hypothetical protein
MRGIQSVRVSRVLVLAALALWACDSTDPVLVGSVSISPVNTTLAVGGSVQLVATVVSTTGSVMSGHPVMWSSSPTSVTSVTPGGLVTAVAPGTSSIRATAEGKSATVAFTVMAGPCVAAMTTGSIALGQSAAGSLDPTDCRLGYQRAEGWNFQLGSATEFRIIMTSSGFPPELVLTDRQLNVVLWGGSDGQRAQLVGELPAGQYIVWATSWADEPAGSYQLSASEARLCDAAQASSIAVGDSVSGSLAASDCVFWHGGSADGFHLHVPHGQGLQVDLSSAAFDAVLVVTDRNMEPLYWDDDSGEGSNARLRRHFPAGEYVLWAVGYGPGSEGAYQLAVTEIELCPLAGDLPLGESVSGTLSTTDCTLEGTRYADPWRLSLSAATTVQLDLTSNDFDAFLILEDAHGGLLAQDDDGGDGYNSRLLFTFEPGDYRVVATSYGGHSVGAYQLSARAVDGSMAATTLSTPNSPAVWLKAMKP